MVAACAKPSTFAAAQPLAVAHRWSATGSDERAVWGRCASSAGEPYEVAVDHSLLEYRCSCPSRQSPCKHAVALLLLWARGAVSEGSAPKEVAEWVARRGPRPVTSHDASGPAPLPVDDESAPSGDPGGDHVTDPPPRQRDGTRNERVARMRAGLVDLHRWLGDRMRTGMADPALAHFATWDQVAARLVDAQVGGLANRVRRIAALVGASTDWRERVLAELGLLAILADAGLRLPELDDGLADSVAVALGWQVRHADVLAGVPDSATWQVLGRSDTREDRIEVRRRWLRAADDGRWAMMLSIAAYGQSLDDSLAVGTVVNADLFRYPGRTRLRALVGQRHGATNALGLPAASTLTEASEQIGAFIAAEPWIDRVPICVRVALSGSVGQWYLTDAGGSMPVVASDTSLATLSACLAEGPATVTAEWTPAGLVPLTVHLLDATTGVVRHVDVGRVAEEGFVARR